MRITFSSSGMSNILCKPGPSPPPIKLSLVIRFRRALSTEDLALFDGNTSALVQRGNKTNAKNPGRSIFVAFIPGPDLDQYGWQHIVTNFIETRIETLHRFGVRSSTLVVCQPVECNIGLFSFLPSFISVLSCLKSHLRIQLYSPGFPELQPARTRTWQNLATLAIDCTHCEPKAVDKILGPPSEVVRYRLEKNLKSPFETCYYHVEDSSRPADWTLKKLALEFKPSIAELMANALLFSYYIKIGWFVDKHSEGFVQLVLNNRSVACLAAYRCPVEVNIFA